MRGFYVPNSISSSYVANKRNEQGSLAYEALATKVGIEKQAALQDLSKQYASAIENAYASYLASQRSIAGSAMGQGYKEAYKAAQQQALIENIANTNMSAAQYRQELQASEEDAQQAIQEQFKAETANLDRVAKSASEYLDYLKTLTGQDGVSTYLTPEQSEQTIDQLYDVVFAAQPQGYLDAEGNKGLTYLQWVNNNLKDTEADNAWAQWLFGLGGYQDFINATKRK